MAENAAIYISDASLLGSKFLNSFRAIKSFRGLRKGGVATGLKIDIGVSKITMNFLPPENLPGHLGGFDGYLRAVGCASKTKLLYTLSRLQHVQCVLGCIIKPGFDAKDKTVRFLLHFTGGLNGLLFIHDSVVDYDGEVLAGPLRND